jgi:hypothetical protein
MLGRIGDELAKKIATDLYMPARRLDRSLLVPSDPFLGDGIGIAPFWITSPRRR